MSLHLSRRHLLHTSVGSIPALLMLAQSSMNAGEADRQAASRGSSSATDFDFFVGEWRVKHHRLAKRLAGSNDWETFEGTTTCLSILGGSANLNDSTVHRPPGVHRGMGLRAFDATTHQWRDWYLDGRTPTTIEVHGIGNFRNGVGTFLADDVYDSRAIKVRGVWSGITRTSFKWEQAFSGDGGATWETNYVMEQVRAS